MKFASWMLLLVLLFTSLSYPQIFGKNKVQYKNFEWYYIQSPHFDVYFYEGGQDIAEFTAEVAESAYVQLKRDFRYDIQERIVFIVYKSHNDWQQTNVVIEYLEEGIGGVTELYKNRIVVPFEGSYEQFRHVIHHELVHAVMNDMLYGGSIQSLVMGEVTPVPLWFAEGLAEFESRGWDPQLDMFVRDAVLNGYIPPLNYLEYYLVYQGGASVFKFIATTYGREKIGEILHKVKGKVIFEKVLESAVGLNYEDFTERWHRWLRKQYWPEVADRKEPVEIAKQLTRHKKVGNFLNVSPAISPNGDKIAYISDRKGYQNIYLMSAIDGKIISTLVKGQRSESFEELHFLRPGMSFSPDGRKLVFSAKSGPWDAIYIVDVKTKKTEKHIVKLDGVFTTSWSPDGNYIAFVGNKDGQSDIFVYRISDGSLIQLTNDVFTDDQPAWSPDSKSIVFTSDRKNFIHPDEIPEDFRMSQFDFESKDIYIISLEDKSITRVTDTEWNEDFPHFSPDGKKLLYTSEQNGISNLFVHNLETGENYPITNIISGIFQIGLDRDANKLVFTTFYNGGFDIYLLNNPFELTPVELQETYYVKEIRGEETPVWARNWKPKKTRTSAEKEQVKGEAPIDYSKYVFSRYKPRREIKKPEDIVLDPEVYQNESGEYKVHKYKLKFSPDFITGAAGYNTFFGFQGYTALAFSDLLGDHQIYLSLNLVSDLKNSDLSLLYLYLKRRINYGFGGFHLTYFFISNAGLVRYRNFGSTFLMSYPFNKFSRLDLYGLWYNVYLEYLDFPIPTEKVSTFLPSLSYVHDTVLWGSTGPVDGSRYSLTLTASTKYNENSRDFRTLQFDYRKYFMVNRDYQFAFRLAAGASFGKNSQQFFLGGIDNWINRKFTGDSLRIERIDDIFFSEFVTPLRGARYYERVGDRFFVTNMEFRFPLIEYLALGFPKLRLFNIRGVLFYDMGSAWYGGDKWYDNSDFRAFKKDARGNTVTDDLVAGYGVGARIWLLYFLLRIDVAWRTDFNSSDSPLWYFSLGADF